MRSREPGRFGPSGAAVLNEFNLFHGFLAPHSLDDFCISLTSLRKPPRSRDGSERRRRPFVPKRLAIETKYVRGEGEEVNVQ